MNESYRNFQQESDTITALRQLLEQPEPVQEPRARLMTYIGKGPYPKSGYTVARTYEECPENRYPDAWEEGEKLYTAPPAQPADHGDELTIAYLDGVHTCKQIAKREWVGLTDEDIEDRRRSIGWSEDFMSEFARAIEAKLKEKNT